MIFSNFWDTQMWTVQNHLITGLATFKVCTYFSAYVHSLQTSPYNTYKASLLLPFLRPFSSITLSSASSYHLQIYFIRVVISDAKVALLSTNTWYGVLNSPHITSVTTKQTPLCYTSYQIFSASHFLT